MKRVLWAIMLLFVFSSAGFAQPPDTAYVGLFTDINHTTFSVMHPGGAPLPFTMYIFWLAPAVGINAVEFMIVYPANIIASTVTPNPAITVNLGSLSAGMSSAWGPEDCQAAGVWVESHHQACFLMNMDQTIIELAPHPTAGGPQIASCELGYPIYPAKKFTNLCLNSDCSYAAPNTTWGAIKSLF